MACWVSPDGRIKKEVLKPGEWSRKPTEGSQCTITITESPLLEDTNRIVIIGDNDGELWRSIDSCLSTMFIREQSKFHITVGDSAISFTLELVSLVFNGFIYEWDAKKIYDHAIHHKEKGIHFFKLKNNKEAAYRFIKGLKLISCIPIDVECSQDIESIDGVPLKDINYLKAKLYNNLSSCYLKNNRWENVIELCNKVLSFDSHNIKALYKLGVAYENDRNFEKALEVFNKVIDLEPQNKASAEHLSSVKGELKRAETKVNKMMKKMFVGAVENL